jgi:hypothetical protein
MTEAEWLACKDPELMLKHLKRGARARKLRLFMCACCRRVWHLIKEPHCREAVEVAEAFVEREADSNTLACAREEADLYWSDPEQDGDIDAREAALYVADPRPGRVAEACASCAAVAAARQRAEQAAQASLLRCIFGNPFCPDSLTPSLRTPIVTGLAAAAYNERLLPCDKLDTRRLAILSDALEEAGCTDAAILSHLRSPGPHVRGCWALDLILGKS